jgi:uncharacterized protein (TIGR03083 family)
VSGRYRSWLADEGERLAGALVGDPATPVPSCPGWTLVDLAGHVGSYHRWAADLIATRSLEPRAPREVRPDPAMPLAEWYRGCLRRLLDAVDATPPDTPMWTVTTDRTVASWPRRQAHDLTVHRWDAQHALGAADTIPPDRASDFIDELFGSALPFIVPFVGRTFPASSLALRTADLSYRRRIDGSTGHLRMTKDAANADATLTGTASDLLLAVWSRPHGTHVDGDPAVLAAWQKAVDG